MEKSAAATLPHRKQRPTIYKQKIGREAATVVLRCNSSFECWTLFLQAYVMITQLEAAVLHLWIAQEVWQGYENQLHVVFNFLLQIGGISARP